MIAHRGRTQASLGDLTSVLSSVTNNAKEQAKTQAIAYAWTLYDEYQTEIWLSGIALAFWVVWVSTRDTYFKHQKPGATASPQGE